MQRVAIAADYIVSFGHLFLKAGIIRRELVGAIRTFDQENSLAVRGMQAVDAFGRTTPSEFPNLRILSSIMATFNAITIVITF